MLAPYSEIGEDPDDFFTMAHESLQMYPAWQEQVREISGQDFEYKRSGSLHVVFHEADELHLQTRLQWQKGWDVPSEIIRGKELQELEPHLTHEAVAAMYYPEEHHIYAPDYVQALKEACLKLGVHIVEQTGAISFQEMGTNGVLLKTEEQGHFLADECIVCSGAWTTLYEQTLAMPLPIFPIKGQICAYEQKNEHVSHIIFSSQGYVLEKGNGTIVCGASEDVSGFDTQITEKGMKRLLKWSRRLFPFLNEEEIIHHWAGLRPATQDGYPLIGRLAHYSNVIISAGHYRNGILLSPRNAQLVADMVEGKESDLDMNLFDPMRFV